MEMLATGIDCSHLEVSPACDSQEITSKPSLTLPCPGLLSFLGLNNIEALCLL